MTATGLGARAPLFRPGERVLVACFHTFCRTGKFWTLFRILPIVPNPPHCTVSKHGPSVAIGIESPQKTATSCPGSHLLGRPDCLFVFSCSCQQPIIIRVLPSIEQSLHPALNLFALALPFRETESYLWEIIENIPPFSPLTRFQFDAFPNSK